MKISRIIILLLFCGMYHQAFADETPVFILKRKSNKEQIPDSIAIDFRKENISTNYGRQIFKAISSDRKGQFTFKLPAIAHLAMFNLIFYYDHKIVKSSKYFVAPEDHIHIRYGKETTGDSLKTQKQIINLDFTGSGYIKYKVRDLLNAEFSMLWATLGKTNNLSMKECSPELQERLNYIFTHTQASDRKASEILDSYREQLGEDMTNFYKSEFDMSASAFANYIFSLFNRVLSMECKRSIASYYFSNRDVFHKEATTQLIAFSYHYVLYTGDQLMLESFLKHNGNKFTFKARYDSLKSTSNPVLREKLLTDFLMDPYLQRNILSFESRDSCITDALKIITAKHLSDALKPLLLFKKGNQVYNFSFSDTSGNRISLGDLKNKVFMIDFYGEGCGGCAKFSKRFKEFIYPEFSDNQQFAVVSVSIDKTRERWFRAMNSGFYTQKSYINLNTGPQGLSHPMLAYYNIKSIPFLLLVDKEGKLISRIESHSNAEIAGMIREALKR